jgi:hypothetical protein
MWSVPGHVGEKCFSVSEVDDVQLRTLLVKHGWVLVDLDKNLHVEEAVHHYKTKLEEEKKRWDLKSIKQLRLPWCDSNVDLVRLIYCDIGVDLGLKLDLFNARGYVGVVICGANSLTDKHPDLFPRPNELLKLVELVNTLKSKSLSVDEKCAVLDIYDGPYRP